MHFVVAQKTRYAMTHYGTHSECNAATMQLTVSLLVLGIPIYKSGILVAAVLRAATW